MLSFLLLTTVNSAASPTPTVLTLAGPKDFVVSGGASIIGSPSGSQNIRSGSPSQTSTVAVATALSPGVVVESVEFSYRYCYGYANTGAGANFTLHVAGSAAYSSPQFIDYPYKKWENDSFYSPPVKVSADKLAITVPKSGQIEFNFQDTTRNVQLLLPIIMTITCAGGSCIKQRPLLPSFFDSNMVLQRGQSVSLWGFDAAAGETINVALGAKKWNSKALANGSWSVALDPQPITTGATITVAASGGRSQTLKNVAFGDVFLCSGQSNMAFSTNLAFNASAEIADSVHYPNLRFFTAATTAASTPQEDSVDIQSKNTNKSLVGPYADSSWAVSSPAAFVPVDGPTFTWPSAVCYFFGRDIYKSLDGKVPIGLLASDWGGQPIAPFMSQEALDDKTCGGTRKIVGFVTETETETGPNEAAAFLSDDSNVTSTIFDSDSGFGSTTQAGGNIWNGMISPLTRMRFAGIVWYQGESDDNGGLKYSCSFPAMISDWRQKLHAPKLPFYFVVLAPCDGHKWCGDFVNVRNAQFTGLLLPQTAYAVAIDLGDVGSPARSVHPRRKQEVGRRLALQALKLQYGKADLVSTGPVMDSITAAVADAGTTTAGLTVKYKAGTAGTLHAAPTPDCDKVGSKLCCGESPFEVTTTTTATAMATATAAGDQETDTETVMWVRVKYTIGKSGAVTLQLPDGVSAGPTMGVRYQWQQWPQCSLYNGKGGPDDHTGIAATPFCWNGTAPCPVH